MSSATHEMLQPTLHQGAAADQRPTPPGNTRMTWLIAQRGAAEALRDRTTVAMSALFALAVPALLAFTVVRPVALSSHGAHERAALGVTIAFYLLSVGLFPTGSSVGVAAGQFAGEKEKGNLTPLLASPADNTAIFFGKALGSTLPSLIFSTVAEIAYLIEVVLIVGPATLRLLPLPLTIAMLGLVPAASFLGAALASFVSSRVRTYNTAQQVTGLLLIPVWIAIFGLAFAMRSWGWLALPCVAALWLLDIVALVWAARGWRREEALAQQ